VRRSVLPRRAAPPVPMVQGGGLGSTLHEFTRVMKVMRVVKSDGEAEREAERNSRLPVRVRLCRPRRAFAAVNGEIWAPQCSTRLGDFEDIPADVASVGVFGAGNGLHRKLVVISLAILALCASKEGLE